MIPEIKGYVLDERHALDFFTYRENSPYYESEKFVSYNRINVTVDSKGKIDSTSIADTITILK